jgi:heme exporter protein D
MSIDWPAFWNLGGHGVYVWPGYLAAALLLAAEIMVLLGRVLGGTTEEDEGEDA